MQVQLQSNSLQISINTFGAELCSIKNNSGLEYLWQANKEIWPRHAPVLFPIVGKLKDNTYTYSNIPYSLSQHGFARDLEFELISETKSSCSFQLRADEESKKQFPFDFTFEIKYVLLEDTLITHYKVLNPSTQDLLFSVGAHPGFNCPIEKDETFEDYYLQFHSSDYKLTQLSNGLRLSSSKKLHLPDSKLALNTALFEKDALVFENSQISSLELLSKKTERSVKMTCENWPYFGIWTKKDCRQFICLEPWFGIADLENTDKDFAQKEGIIRLAPKNEFNCSFSLQFG